MRSRRFINPELSPYSGVDGKPSNGLYEAWKSLNDEFLFSWGDDQFLIAGRDLPPRRESSSVTYGCEISGIGFNLPEAQPFVGVDRRIRLLRGRYVDPTLWNESLNRLDLKKKNLGGPMSYVFPFHRAATGAPTGGGCLISVTLSWYRKSWRIHVMSRASEITIRLLGDMYFIQHMVDEIIEQIPLKNWPEKPPINWHFLMCSQKRYVIPYYLLHTRGEAFVLDYMTDPKPKNLRHSGVQEYFWDSIVHPERVTWVQRRKWSEKFMRDSTLEWGALELARLQAQQDSRIIDLQFDK